MVKARIAKVKRFVVIDASPLIGLATVGGLSWLPKFFDTIYVPETVKSEVLPGTMARGEDAITQAFEFGWLKVWQEPINPLLDIDLDAGETDCINIAMEYADQVLLVMDERAGRAVAKEIGLKVTGTAAIIGIAKRQGLIVVLLGRPLIGCISQILGYHQR